VVIPPDSSDRVCLSPSRYTSSVLWNKDRWIIAIDHHVVNLLLLILLLPVLYYELVSSLPMPSFPADSLGPRRPPEY
jgi:hypothetical protein